AVGRILAETATFGLHDGEHLDQLERLPARLLDHALRRYRPGPLGHGILNAPGAHLDHGGSLRLLNKCDIQHFDTRGAAAACYDLASSLVLPDSAARGGAAPRR